MKLPRNPRYDYNAITKRPAYEWPNGARLAVCINNNIEEFAYRAGLGPDHTLPVGNPPQTARNVAWREYGNRVGIFYYLEALDEYGIPGAHNCNSAVLENCPDIVEALNARGDEYVGHGRTNSERQDGWWEEDEARMIAECTEVVTRLSGSKPVGWLGPYLAHSAVTPDLLKEAGYQYLMDLPADDQPFWMRTRSGPILSVPYPIEINDSPAMVYRHHTGREFAEMIIDQFDEMLRLSAKRPLVFGVSLHPFVIGQPFRLGPFRRALEHILERKDELWITRPRDVAAYCMSMKPGIIPGSQMLQGG
jgi:peptidoglycan/xylan/chitin deacetylase (PgdA/CDA1 family)